MGTGSPVGTEQVAAGRCDFLGCAAMVAIGAHYKAQGRKVSPSSTALRRFADTFADAFAGSLLPCKIDDIAQPRYVAEPEIAKLADEPAAVGLDHPPRGDVVSVRGKHAYKLWQNRHWPSCSDGMGRQCSAKHL